MKRFVLLAVAAMVLFTAIPSFAAEEGEKGASKEAYEHADRRSIFNRTSDWFATVGKSQEEKDRIMEERNAKRAEQRAAREAAGAERKAAKEAEEAKKEAEKTAEKSQKEAEKAAEKAEKEAEKAEKKAEKDPSELMEKPGKGESKGQGKAKGRKW